jgi:hypothetical protein
MLPVDERGPTAKLAAGVSLGPAIEDGARLGVRTPPQAATTIAPPAIRRMSAGPRAVRACMPASSSMRADRVVVHEHCQRPIGVAPCRHIEGSPVRDAFRAIDRLLATWIDPDAPDCARLLCLD